MNRTLAWALKLAIAAGIVGFLIATDRLSVDPLRSALADPMIGLALVASHVMILALGVARWRILLRSVDGRSRSFWTLLAYTWMGQFFGTVAPSSAATDLTRYHYLRQDGDATTGTTLTSLLVDRLCGVIGICLLAAVFAGDAIVRVRMVTANVAWKLVIAIAIVLILIALAVRLRHRLRIVRAIDRARVAVRAAAVSWPTTLAALALSLLAHALKVVTLWLIVRTAGPELSIATLFRFAPVGFVVEALPLAPGGLGTAHLAFDHLFGMYGIAGGAALFNVYFVTRVLANLGGGLIWLARSRSRRAARS